jgi:hypothetical protein
VDGQRAPPCTCAQPTAHDLAVEDERAARAALVRWPLAIGDEWAMRYADRWEVHHRAEV